MVAKLVDLPRPAYRDPAAMLRAIADEIEAGEHGGSVSVALALRGSELAVFGGGAHATAPETGMLLFAGLQFLNEWLAVE